MATQPTLANPSGTVPPQHAGKTTFYRAPKRPSNYDGTSTDAAALAVPEESIGMFHEGEPEDRGDFATHATGANLLGERLKAFHEAQNPPEGGEGGEGGD